MSPLFRHSATVVLLASCLVQPGPARGATPPPPEAFGHIPVESDVVLSPGGRWLAWLDHAEPKARVVMFDLTARKVQRMLAVPEHTKLRALEWNDDETLLITVSETREAKVSTTTSAEVVRTIAQDVGGGDGRMLPTDDEPQGKYDPKHRRTIPASLIAARTTKPKTVIMATYGTCKAVFAACLWEVDTRTGHRTVIKVGARYTTEWVVDRDGHAVAREDWDWMHHQYRLYAVLEDKPRELLRRDDGERPKLAGLLADGTALALIATNGRSHEAAWALPLDGTPPRLLADDPDADVSNVQVDANTGAISGVYVAGTVDAIRWVDAAAQRRFDALQRAFPGRHVDVYGWTADGTKTLAAVETPALPPVFYIVDFETHRADIAAEEYPSLAGAALGEMRQISYKARDGTVIPAYLTLPPGAAPGPQPLVVLPHGGPIGRDHFRFNWLVQFLATRGYAVLQPQFRGSSGFGSAFEQAGYKEWGGLMQDDVTDGVRAMIDGGVADPHRIAIVGMSYGGYAALVGAAFTPDLYACAASINGISDVAALMREEVDFYSGADSTDLAYWKEHIGEPNDPRLSSRSPINAVKAIRAPVLLVYGTGDAVVPTAQSERMAGALTGAGKSVVTVVLRGEDHWLSLSDTRTQVLTALGDFLKKNL